MGEEHLISLQPGTVIAGRYEVVKCLGAGSMGLVYACRHRELSGHLVAAKVLFPEVALDKVASQRFKNEIFASYGVSHPNVVRAYEYIRDGDLIAYTMEFVGGGDLADRLSKGVETFTIGEIVKLLSQMCSGVQAIHDAGIVHRDLKPENILLTKEGDVKIADFGIARTERGPKLTEHGGVVGTIDYVSPEYMLNSHVDWRSDIYAIGILGYEMITGESPFPAESVYAKMTKRLKTDPPMPSLKRRDCPKELDEIIVRAMARDPEERYQSAAEMFYDLKKMSPDLGSAAGFLAHPSLPKSPKSQPKIEIAEDSSTSSGQLKNEKTGNSTVRKNQSLRSNTIQEGVGSSHQVYKDSPYDKSISSRIPTQQLSALNPTPSSVRNQKDNSRRSSVNRNNDISQEHQPMKMESVLAYKDLVSTGWKAQPSPSGIKVGLEDGDKLKRLSNIVSTASKSSFFDYAVLALSVIMGIILAFMIINYYFPKTQIDEKVQEAT